MKKTSLKMPALKMPEFSGLKNIKIDSSKLVAILSYLHILVIVSYFYGKKDKYVAYHAKQGMILLGLWILFGFTFYLPLLPYIVLLLIITCMIIGITNAISGEKRSLPLIGKLV